MLQGNCNKTQTSSRQQEVQPARPVRPTSPTRRGPVVPRLPVQSKHLKMIALPVERSPSPQPPHSPAAPQSSQRATQNRQQWWHTAGSSHAGVSTPTSPLHGHQAGLPPKPCLKTDKQQGAPKAARPLPSWDRAEQLKSALAPVKVPRPAREYAANLSSPTAPLPEPPSTRRSKACVSPVLDRWTDDESAQPPDRLDRARPSGSITKREGRGRFRRHSTTAALARSIMLDSQLIGDEASSEMSSPLHPQVRISWPQPLMHLSALP